MPLVLAKGSKTPGHSDENNGAVASLPRNQRCWHRDNWRGVCRYMTSHRFRETNAVGTGITITPVETPRMSHRFRETNAVGTSYFRRGYRRDRSRIASEKPTLLAHVQIARITLYIAVASLPRNQRCWHPMYLQRLEDDIPSHRFRETNAVGTSVSHSHSKSLNRRIASEKPTLLAQERKRRTLRAGRSHRFRETNAVGTRSGTTKRARRSVASLPRNQRCWHKNSLRLRIGRSPSRIASEKPTLLARPPGRNDTARARSHRFRETNAVGTSSACSTSWATQSHRFRETNAVGTGLSSICLTKGAPRRIASEKPTLLAPGRRRGMRRRQMVASLPRNQRCWHNHPVCLECSRACRIASERSTLLARVLAGCT